MYAADVAVPQLGETEEAFTTSPCAAVPLTKRIPTTTNGYTRLGINRTWSDGMRARTFDHDFYTQLLRNEMRLRKSASETLKVIQSFPYEEEPDPAPRGPPPQGRRTLPEPPKTLPLRW